MSAYDLPWIMKQLGYSPELIAGVSVEEPRLSEVLAESPVEWDRPDPETVFWGMAKQPDFSSRPLHVWGRRLDGESLIVLGASPAVIVSAARRHNLDKKKPDYIYPVSASLEAWRDRLLKGECVAIGFAFYDINGQEITRFYAR